MAVEGTAGGCVSDGASLPMEAAVNVDAAPLSQAARPSTMKRVIKMEKRIFDCGDDMELFYINLPRPFRTEVQALNRWDICAWLADLQILYSKTPEKERSAEQHSALL